MVPGFLKSAENLKAVGDIICLADTGVTRVTAEENTNADEIKLPDSMPDDVKEMILEQNRTAYKFWVKSTAGELVEFDEDSMSDGTIRLFEVLPLILTTLQDGAPLFIDEMNAHFHTHLSNLVLQLFHDHGINNKGAQIIFTTHDTNILDPDILRRDQIWLVSKEGGVSSLRALDEYDKRYVRSDSPFEAFYKDGRLGAIPRLSYSDVRAAILAAIRKEKPSELGDGDA